MENDVPLLRDALGIDTVWQQSQIHRVCYLLNIVTEDNIYNCSLKYNRGKTRARDAALNAIQSSLLDIGIETATRIVWNITGGSDVTLLEVNAATKVVNDLVYPSDNLIFGVVIDPLLSGQVNLDPNMDLLTSD